MNDQIDSSIPVLTEVIAPRATTANESKTSTQKPTPPQSPNVQQPQPAPLLETNTVASIGAQPQIAPPLSSVQMPTPTASIAVATQTTQATKTAQLEELEKLTNNASSAEEWLQIEQSVKENVLRQVLSRVDFVLEHRVRDSLADVLQSAVDQLADDIRAGLRKSLDEVITRAVTQELTRIKGNKL
jgi:hypothetical protein